MTNCDSAIPAGFREIASSVAEIQVSDEKTIVSLFSGCGGMDLGFLGGFEFMGKTYDRLRYRIEFANDISAPACKTYLENIGDHIHQGDVEEMIDSLPASCDILGGGFPCQDVSINGKRSAGEGSRTILYNPDNSRAT